MAETKSRFSTRIEASGPNGNILVVLGTATRMMRELKCGRDEIDGLRSKVMASHSYAAAIEEIRKWFPVRIGK
jgi:hypothetical protein